MKTLTLIFGFLAFSFNICFAENASVLKVQLSPGNLPTQRVSPGTENVEILRIWLSASLQEEVVSTSDDGIFLKKLKFKRTAEGDRDQLIRYKLQYKNQTLGKISLPDSDVLEFKNLNILVPFEKTIEFRILADTLSGDASGMHKFELTDTSALTLEIPSNTEIKISGKFPIRANKILIGNEFFSPSEECNLRVDPVCGVDGKTYYNLCLPFKKNIDIDYEGSCHIIPTTPTTPCPENFDPICGDNGRTYQNRCFLDRTTVLWDYNGECFPTNFQRPKTFQSAVELYGLKSNELVQSRPRISEVAAKSLQNIADVLSQYPFTLNPKAALSDSIANFITFTLNPSDRIRLEQEIELLRIALIKSKQASAKEKFGQHKIPFLDVDENEWFFPHVKFLKEKGWVSGYENFEGEETGKFEPANSVTKAEITKMAFNAANVFWNTQEETAPKNTSAKGHWAEGLILRAEEKGLTLWEDFPNPNKKADRGEVIQLLFEVFEINPPQGFEENFFPDVLETDPKYPFVQYAKALGIIEGYSDGTFLPNSPISRAEVAKVIKLAYEKLPRSVSFEAKKEEDATQKQNQNLLNMQMFAVPYISPNFHFYMNIPGLYRFQSFDPTENEIMRFGFANKNMYDERDVNFWLKIIGTETPLARTIYKKEGNKLVIDFYREQSEKTFFRLEGLSKFSDAMNFLQKSIEYTELTDLE